MIATRVRKNAQVMVYTYFKRIVQFVAFLLFVFLLYWGVEQFKQYFPIKMVKVFGVKHMDALVVQKTLTPLVNKNFFSVNVNSIKEHLLQSPWVANVVVQRVWPDQMIITLIEKTPWVRWNNASLISTQGELFTPDKKSMILNLPRLQGATGQHLQMLDYYQRLSKILRPLHYKIASLELTPEYSWHVTLDNGIKLSLGYKDVLTRMAHFVKVYPKVIGDRFANVDYVDLRYSNGLAVRWKTVT